VLTQAPNPEGARRFIRYLASPAAAGVIKDTGLDPVAKP
jgi:ABC-type molybdate transport system substrate-binding protein